MSQQVSKALEVLQNKITEIGYAKVAITLGYKDTGSIKKWIKRGSIPPSAVALITKLWGHGKTVKNTI